MVAASSSSSSSSSSSESDVSVHNTAKRRIDESDSDSDSDLETNAIAVKDGRKERKQTAGLGTKGKRSSVHAEDSEEESDAQSDGDVSKEADEDDEVKVLSHKEQRRLKKKQKTIPSEDAKQTSDATTTKAKSKTKDAIPKRQHSVWVGNLSFRTTPDALRAFFTDAGAGEVTRVHMPMKGALPGAVKMTMVKPAQENRGFAYVDFSTAEGKAAAISLSEKNLDGRRLLIKDGDDFTGRPTPTIPTTDSTGDEHQVGSTEAPTAAASSKTGYTKTAQKILSAQKQPPCPCLFLGNLGFEATEERIREMFEGHARALAEISAKKGKGKGKRDRDRDRAKAKGDDDLMDVQAEEKDEDEEEGEESGEGEKIKIDVGIKKVRMGTFEDTGVCKGFAFVDFTSTAHATAALTNPRNHHLDGRALVVEYASAEAARRGGYRAPAPEGGRKRTIPTPKRGGEDKYNDRRKRRREEDVEEEGGRLGAVHENGDQHKTQAKDEGTTDPKAQRRRTENPEKNTKGTRNTKYEKETRPGKRPKPGAALALAQREKYAIVPSEGTRLKFS